MPQSKSKEQILSVARDIVATEGLGAVSFDVIARRLGRTKQAVLYWFPSKRKLLAAMFLPWLEAETEAAVSALEDATGRDPAVASFVRAITAFHFADLDRFRMMYLVPQTTRTVARKADSESLLEQVHPVTDRLYGALAAHLDGPPAAARREAMAIHSAVLGLVLMFALGDTLDDPLKHGEAAMVEALCALLTGNQR